jgi:hypothetical protein
MNPRTEDSFAPFRSVCQQSTGRTYDLHREAIANQDWLAAGVWGAVFLEAFLEEVCRALNVSIPDRLELGDAINRLRGVKDLKGGREVLDLCDGVRMARNGLVHARTNVESGTLTLSTTIQNYINEILALATPWFGARPDPTGEAQEALPIPVGRVFLSTINPHSPRQEAFLRDLQLEMRAKCLEPVRMRPTTMIRGIQ